MKRQIVDRKRVIKKNIELRNSKLIFLRGKKQNNMDDLDEIRNRKPLPKETSSSVRLDMRLGTEVSNKVNQVINKKIDTIFLQPFERKMVVDYDAVVIIASYNRFDKLFRLLNQLHTQKTKHRIKIIVYDDGSTDVNYNILQINFPNIDYIRGGINNSKQGYWKTITTLFKKTSEYISHTVIQIDDDFILCENFIDKLVNLFFEAKTSNNKNVAIYYHIPNNSKTAWGMNGWIDGGASFDADFLREINYSIDSIPERRWKSAPEISSGVWRQVSEKIHNNGLFVYKLDYSLAEHDGNDESKMNIEQRKTNPIFTQNFKKD